MKKELWLRLKHYHFHDLVPAHLMDHVAAAFGGSDASTKAFANKIARKLKWRTPFALAAIGEYKKFVYLGVVGEFSVTPSRVIDQVWHEHLLFSKAYRDFCREVVGRDFDHNPELMPTSDQTAVFEAQYNATLAFYQQEFKIEPPGAIWDTPKFKTDDATKAVKVPQKKRDDFSPGFDGDDDTPLYLLFSDSSSSDGSYATMPEFGGGGGFSGGGGGDFWGDAHHSSDSSGHDSGSGSSSDSGGSSASGGSSDAGGSSCSAGSGCSSSCGGGGCGSS